MLVNIAKPMSLRRRGRSADVVTHFIHAHSLVKGYIANQLSQHPSTIGVFSFILLSADGKACCELKRILLSMNVDS